MNDVLTLFPINLKNLIMDRSTNQAAGTQPQFNNVQPQRLQNIGGQLPRPQNNENNADRFDNAFDLVNGTEPFNRMENIEHPPEQDIQFSTSLFSGQSFP
ncbi:hypothetical protein C2G38_2249946 [Gigaspora rosea]|uniref:Uncharacterized protein n=1 Tax=Gigaspora rosea TaxID=44941 RepID=A0A397UQB4_9GLOM|nr:hypothetical protein C2G38_2249946 [Gigaspora rosea]